MQKRRKRRKSRGIITVFVTLIMVPVVTCTGTMVDVARLKLYSSQAAMAADSYGEVVLSQFDNVLKDLYGLFSVTQDEAGKQAIIDLAKNVGYSFVPNGDDESITGFMPYKDAKLNITYKALDGTDGETDSGFDNHNVMMTQISEFMKFRVIEEVLAQTGVFDKLDSFKTMDADMAAIDTRTEITDSGLEALEKIGEYYKNLKVIHEYQEFQESREKTYKDYAQGMADICNSGDYDKYVFYLRNKDAIEAAIKAVDEYNEALEKYEEELEEYEAALAATPVGGTPPSEPEEPEKPSEDVIELAEKYKGYDAGAYQAQISAQITTWKNNLEKPEFKVTYDGDTFDVDFGKMSERIDKLSHIAAELESALVTLEEKVSLLKSQLATCQEKVKDPLSSEIAQLENIVELAKDFTETCELLISNQNAQKDADNKILWEEKTVGLPPIGDSLISGSKDPGSVDWDCEIELDWYDFCTDKAAFYDALEEMCEGQNGEDLKAAKKYADKQQKKAKKETDTKIKKLKEDDDNSLPKARDITSQLAAELDSTTSEQVPDLADCLSGGASFGSLVTGAVDKFMVTTYDAGMFSSRVSGVKPPEDGEGDAGEVIPAAGTEEEEYVDRSLTKYKMSKDINYLYGAELEYLIAGHNKSKSNLSFTRNVICGVRMAMNFVSTYSVEAIDTPIKKIANTAYTAVAAVPIVGTALAPVVKVAVSGALRLAASTIETYNDWKALMNREKVFFFKDEMNELTTTDMGEFSSLIDGFTGTKSGTKKKAGAGEIMLSYEDYLFVMMCLFVNEDDLLKRTSNLITLNVNKSQTTEDKLTSLDFKMSETVTAIKSTCEVDLKFLIVPKNFVNMFLDGSDTQSIIQKLDDTTYGYSIIRGY